jgi:hypothetical protein
MMIHTRKRQRHTPNKGMDRDRLMWSQVWCRHMCDPPKLNLHLDCCRRRPICTPCLQQGPPGSDAHHGVAHWRKKRRKLRMRQREPDSRHAFINPVTSCLALGLSCATRKAYPPLMYANPNNNTLYHMPAAAFRACVHTHVQGKQHMCMDTHSLQPV